MRIGVGTNTDIIKKAGFVAPNKAECLQSVVNKKPEYNTDTGYYEYEDSIGKVEKTPLNGNVYNFEGDDDYVNLGSKHLLMPNGSTDEFTLKLRFKADNVSPLSTIIGKYNTGDNEREWLLWIFGSKVSFIMPNTDNYSNRIGKISNNNIVAGEWYDVEIHYDGSETEAGITFLLNGVEQTASDSAGTYSGLTQGNANIMIGGYFNSGTFERGFDGIVSDVKFFNADEKLVHAWHCDETAGDVCYDSVKYWLGDDLITNGDFTTDVAGWSHLKCDLTREEVGGESYAIVEATVSNNDNRIYQNAGLKEDTWYLLKFRAKSNDITSRFTYEYYSDYLVVSNPSLSTEWQDYEIKIKPWAGATSYIYIRQNMVVGKTYHIDDITVEEVHEPVNGTLEGIYAPTFFAEDIRFKSYQNEIGYSEIIQTNGTDAYILETELSGEDIDSIEFGCYISEEINESSPLTAIGSLFNDPDSLISFGSSAGFETNETFSFWTTEVSSHMSYIRDVISTGFHIIKVVWNNETSQYDIYLDNIKRQVYPCDGNSYALKATSHKLSIGKRGTKYGALNLYYFKINDEYIQQGHNINAIDHSLDYPLVPVAIDENDEGTELDIFGSEPTYLGLTKNNLKAVNNSCLEFDGGNYVEMEDNISDLSSFTLKTRFKTNNQTTQYRIMGTIDTNIKGFLLYQLNTGILNFGIRGTASQTEPIGTVIDGWNTLELIYNSSTISGTLNNIPFEVSTTGGIEDPIDPLFVGTYYDKSDNLNGLVDYVIIETPNKIYTYNFGEGAGDFVYDRTEIAYGDDVITDTFPHIASSGYYSVPKDGDIANGEEWIIKYKISSKEPGAYLRMSSTSSFPYSSSLPTTLNEEIVLYRTAINNNNVLKLWPSGAAMTFEYVKLIKISEPINGTLEGSPTWTTDSKATPDNLINGFSQGFSQGNTAGLVNFGQQDLGTEFTMYGIVNIPSNSTSARLFGAEPGTTGTTTKCYPYILATNGTVGFYGMGLDTSFTSSPVITGEGNKELMFTFTPTTVTLFVDGEEISSLSITNAGFSAELTAFDRSTGDRTFLGDMFDIKFISGIKTVEEMRALQQNNTYTYDGTNPPELLRLPSQTGNTGLDVFGNTLSNPSGKFHNNAETKIEEYKVPTLYKTDGNDSIPMKYLYGEELVTNRHFDTDTAWRKQPGWTIPGGKAICDGTSGVIYQEDIVIPSNTDVIVRFEIKDYVSGTVRPRVENLFGTYVSGNGVYSEVVNSGTVSANCLFGIDSNNFVGSIDNVSFKKVNDQTPSQIEYRDMPYDVYEEDEYHKAFMNAEEIKKRNMLIYDREQTGINLTKIEKKIKKP